jgi:hypothetical protein
MENLITSSEVAKLLGKSVSAVNRDAQLGYLPVAYKVPGKTGSYLFDRAAVEAKAAQRRADKASA